MFLLPARSQLFARACFTTENIRRDGTGKCTKLLNGREPRQHSLQLVKVNRTGKRMKVITREPTTKLLLTCSPAHATHRRLC
jgi:hypothetical protein